MLWGNFFIGGENNKCPLNNSTLCFNYNLQMSFSHIFLLDLHSNSFKKTSSPCFADENTEFQRELGISNYNTNNKWQRGIEHLSFGTRSWRKFGQEILLNYAFCYFKWAMNTQKSRTRVLDGLLVGSDFASQSLNEYCIFKCFWKIVLPK